MPAPRKYLLELMERGARMVLDARGGSRPPTHQVIGYIGAHKDGFGIEPI
jgi:hypothetical protein